MKTIQKGQNGLTLRSNEDTRSDTTRLGYNENALRYLGGEFYLNPFLLILDILNTPINSNLITGTVPGVGSTAKLFDKGLRVTKGVNTAVKADAAFLKQDARPFASGRNRFTEALRLEARKRIIRDNHPLYKELKNVEIKIDKTDNPRTLNLLKRRRNDILDRFLGLKKGGVIKALEGTKLNFWLKTGNFINSDLGKGLLNMVAGGLSTINNSVKATNYANEFDEATEALVKAMLQLAYDEKYKLGLLLAPMVLLSDGNINYSNIDYQLFAKLYAEGNSDLSSIAKFEMDRLKEKLELINAILGSSSGFGDILKLGLGMVGDYLNKKSTSKSEIPNYYKLFFGKTELPKVDLTLTYKDMLIPQYFKPINLKNNTGINKLNIDLYNRMI